MCREHLTGPRAEVSCGNAHEDALRRDLTINALFYDVESGVVEDCTGRGIQVRPRTTHHAPSKSARHTTL